MEAMGTEAQPETSNADAMQIDARMRTSMNPPLNGVSATFVGHRGRDDIRILGNALPPVNPQRAI
jgi:hypothetical protein